MANPDHEQLHHVTEEMHHHHRHATNSRHEQGHHLLSVENLSVSFRLYDPDYPGYLRAPKVDLDVLKNVSLSVHRGELLALVGGSGAGKSVLADAIVGRYEPNASVCGRIWYDGKRCDVQDLAELRRRKIGYMPQSLQSLDPLMTVGNYLRFAAKQGGGPDPNRTRTNSDVFDSDQAIKDALERFALEPEVLKLYPHELSGGMARRVIAIATLLRAPELLIADEPTPGLDEHLATRLLSELRRVADRGGAVLLITHDLSLALQWADRVAVFHEGRIVEETSAAAFTSPDQLQDPFTRALWHAMPEHGFEVVKDA